MSTSKKFGRLSQPICKQIDRLSGGEYAEKNDRRRKTQKMVASIKRQKTVRRKRSIP